MWIQCVQYVTRPDVFVHPVWTWCSKVYPCWLLLPFTKKESKKQKCNGWTVWRSLHCPLMGKALPMVSLNKSLFRNSDFLQWSKIRRNPVAAQGKKSIGWILGQQCIVKIITQGALAQGQYAMAQYRSLFNFGKNYSLNSACPVFK